MYIGSTNNFNVRFGTDLRHESTHTLIKKLLKAEIHSDRSVAADYFKNHNKYKVKLILPFKMKSSRFFIQIAELAVVI